MKQIDTGILQNSQIQFFSRSILAKKLYFHILCIGHFFCDNNYHLVRDNYDSILLILIKDGSFTFRDSNGEFVTANKNSMVILDCYEPHEYYTNDYTEFLWMHIDGANSREFCSEIVNTNGNLVSGSIFSEAERLFLKIYNASKENEREISLLIYRLLTQLVSSNKTEIDDKGILYITKAKEYIADHLDEEITTGIIADELHISPTHLSRLFRKHTGFSPYDYVIAERINKAKEYLLTTDKSVTDIAYLTGFNSQANFIYCFKNHEGISPGRFRKLKF
jgi:AraC-like DNA-binding protein